MLILAFAVFLAAAPQATPTPAPPPQPPPNPCDAAEFRQFDFWIGRWEVTGPQGAVLGTNTIEPLAGNCGVHENWTGTRGGVGRSLNTYQASDGKWHQVWVGSGGGMLRLSGGLKGGAMVLEGETVGPNNAKTLHRVTWTPLADGLRQFWQSSADGGQTWTVSFDGHYSRKK